MKGKPHGNVRRFMGIFCVRLHIMSVACSHTPQEDNSSVP